MMSSFGTKLTFHQQSLRSLSPHLPSITSLLSSQTITQPSPKLFHTSAIVQRPRKDRDPNIKITLEQLRMAARGSGRRAPICHDQQEKVMNSLEAANYEVSSICSLFSFSHNIIYFAFNIRTHMILLLHSFSICQPWGTYLLMPGQNSLIYKYIIEYDKCREDYELNHKGKDRAMMKELNKYLVRKRKK